MHVRTRLPPSSPTPSDVRPKLLILDALIVTSLGTWTSCQTGDVAWYTFRPQSSWLLHSPTSHRRWYDLNVTIHDVSSPRTSPRNHPSPTLFCPATLLDSKKLGCWTKPTWGTINVLSLASWNYRTVALDAWFLTLYTGALTFLQNLGWFPEIRTQEELDQAPRLRPITQQVLLFLEPLLLRPRLLHSPRRALAYHRAMFLPHPR